MKPLWEVIVGNIGTVYSGTSAFKATYTFNTYAGQSMSLVGRAGAEAVTLMRNEEIWREYQPKEQGK